MEDSFSASRDVIIRTESFEQAIQFYESVLGLKVFQNDKSMVGFEAGSFHLYVERGPKHGAVFEFLVPDLQAAKQALISAGCVVVEENAALPRCYLRDPFGLLFNIAQRDGA